MNRLTMIDLVLPGTLPWGLVEVFPSFPFPEALPVRCPLLLQVLPSFPRGLVEVRRTASVGFWSGYLKVFLSAI